MEKFETIETEEKRVSKGLSEFLNRSSTKIKSVVKKIGKKVVIATAAVALTVAAVFGTLSAVNAAHKDNANNAIATTAVVQTIDDRAEEKQPEVRRLVDIEEENKSEEDKVKSVVETVVESPAQSESNTEYHVLYNFNSRSYSDTLMKGNTKISTDKYKNNQLVSSYTYFKNGEVKTATHYDERNSSYYLTTQYDSNGNKTKEEWSNKSGTGYEIYKAGEHSPVESVKKDHDGNIIESIKTTNRNGKTIVETMKAASEADKDTYSLKYVDGEKVYFEVNYKDGGKYTATKQGDGTVQIKQIDKNGKIVRNAKENTSRILSDGSVIETGSVLD